MSRSRSLRKEDGLRASLRQTQNRNSKSNAKDEKKLREAYEQIDRIGGNMNLIENTRNSAKEMYLKMTDYYREKEIPIRQRDALIGAVIFLACQRNGHPRTLMEVTEKGVRRNKVGKISSLCKKVLGLESDPTKATELIERYCSQCLSSSGMHSGNKPGRCVLPL